jgi:hypothetical protein
MDLKKRAYIRRLEKWCLHNFRFAFRFRFVQTDLRKQRASTDVKWIQAYPREMVVSPRRLRIP